MSFFFALHLLSAVIWVGGMFFAYNALRPVAATLLEPPIRLSLWRDVFKKFFVWVWACILLLPISGYVLVFSHFQGMANVGISIHIMQLTGWIMIGIFLYVFFVPYKSLISHLHNQNIPEAGKQLNKIRQLIATNLGLGILTIVIASTQRF